MAKRYEFFSATGIKLIAIKAVSIAEAQSVFRIKYPFWDYGYVVRV